MNESIKAGDLVMVVRPSPCGCDRSMGVVFHVRAVAQLFGHCAYCFQERFSWSAVAEDNGVWELSRLLRIKPLSEPESTEHKDEVTA